MTQKSQMEAGITGSTKCLLNCVPFVTACYPYYSYLRLVCIPVR